MGGVFLTNLGSPPLLFFFLGAAAALLRSDLEIPTQVAKFLSLYLLLAIGYKGGVALASNPLEPSLIGGLVAALLLACVVPLYTFTLLRRRLPLSDAAAIAATYGSVSAVTFITCASYLDASAIAWSGYLVAAMALMESPAIIIGLLLYRLSSASRPQGAPAALEWRELLREACLNGSVFLILGSMLIGWITGQRGMEQVQPFVGELFVGMLCLFLLDMGIVAARRLQELRSPRAASHGAPPLRVLIGFALALPLVNALLAATLALLVGLGEGDALLLTVLGASASYIAVPAALRLALPEANPGIYLPMSLAITFPFNLLLGIPLYHLLLQHFGGF